MRPAVSVLVLVICYVAACEAGFFGGYHSYPIIKHSYSSYPIYKSYSSYPIVKSYPIYKSYSYPVIKSYPIYKSYSYPVYKSYHSSPIVIKSSYSDWW